MRPDEPTTYAAYYEEIRAIYRQWVAREDRWEVCVAAACAGALASPLWRLREAHAPAGKAAIIEMAKRLRLTTPVLTSIVDQAKRLDECQEYIARKTGGIDGEVWE